MPGPSDERFGSESAPLRLASALDLLGGLVVPVAETEVVALKDARGRVLAEDVAATRNLPPHDNSAVDGYALRHADLRPSAETRMAIGGRIAAGHPLDEPVKPVHAYRIFTGAPVPDGCDTIVMQEHVGTADSGVVVLPANVKRGANVRRAGEDLAPGDRVLRRGARLAPQHMAMAAALGLSRLTVYRRLRVAVFSTGDEIQDPDAVPRAGCVFDANRYALMGLLETFGCRLTDLGILPDDPAAIRRALGSASKSHDVLFTSGGISIGDEDHVRDAVRDLGTLDFWRLAIKPGRPLAMGRINDTFFIGLPGNPVAALVTALRVARPLILRRAGVVQVQPNLFRVSAGFSFRKKAGRREWLRAHLEERPGHGLFAVKFRTEGSGVLSSMVAADGLVELPEDAEVVEEGDLVDFLPFSEVMQ